MTTQTTILLADTNKEYISEVKKSESVSHVVIEKMEPIPAGDNPFNHDFESIGTMLVRDIVVMHPGYDNKESPSPIGWIYLVNTRTGNRVKILIDDNF